MTVLENSIHVDASPKRVWAALAQLDRLHEYDPGVKRAQIISTMDQGSGTERRCELTPGGWFEERVTEWEPAEALGFELFDCSLPVKQLRYRYTLEPDGDGTSVSQRMEYDLKFGLVGKLMDALMVRRRWDAGIRGFFAGLKRHVESVNR
jgi:carbon monoxide dehydrogenase subunit G